MTFKPSFEQVNPNIFLDHNINPEGFILSTGRPLLNQQPQYHSFEINNLIDNVYPSLNNYIVNGRTTKPYEVKEQHNEGFLFKPNPIQSSRESIEKLNELLKSYSFNQQFNQPSITHFLNNGFSYNQIRLPTIQQPIFNRNHGPVALGSGSLGYLKLSNGVIFIGSGSLGYISQQQHADAVRLKLQQPRLNSLPSPLTFGPNV